MLRGAGVHMRKPVSLSLCGEIDIRCMLEYCFQNLKRKEQVLTCLVVILNA